MRTIRVTGKGQIKVKPDMTRITMALEGLFKEYGETLRHSSEETEALKDVLSGFGFERADLKTLNFSVDTEYESYKDRDGSYKQHFSGYRFRHMLKVEFSSDNDRLGKVLYSKRPGGGKEHAARKGRCRREGKGVRSDPGRRSHTEGTPDHRLFLGRDRF